MKTMSFDHWLHLLTPQKVVHFIDSSLSKSWVEKVTDAPLGTDNTTKEEGGGSGGKAREGTGSMDRIILAIPF